MSGEDRQTAAETNADEAVVIDPGDLLRGRTYMLLATLLAAPPDQAMLDLLRRPAEHTDAPLEGEAGEVRADSLRNAWQTLAQAARATDPEACAGEYQELFIGIGRGELVPYGSWYRTGFLMETPLAELRTDLERLGFERNQEVAEPEDHAAALCEVMAMLCGVEADTPPVMEEQRAFYRAHLAPWLGRFFHDLQQASNSRFYRPVGALGEAFMALEARYLEMPV